MKSDGMFYIIIYYNNTFEVIIVNICYNFGPLVIKITDHNYQISLVYIQKDKIIKKL